MGIVRAEALVSDERWMLRALRLAEESRAVDEVPVGAVLVKDNTLVAQGCNRMIGDCDPTAHAEIVALRNAAKALGNYRLVGCTLYVTVEPCAMCAGALVHARVQRLVFGAHEPRSGAVVSMMQLLDNPRLNHSVACLGGICGEQCGQLMAEYFAGKRKVGNRND